MLKKKIIYIIFSVNEICITYFLIEQRKRNILELLPAMTGRNADSNKPCQTYLHRKKVIFPQNFAVQVSAKCGIVLRQRILSRDWKQTNGSFQ